MKKKLISLTTAALMFATLFATPVVGVAAENSTTKPLPTNQSQAAQKSSEESVAYSEGIVGGNIYFDESTGTITSCDESVTSAIIPETINDIPVIQVGAGAFFACKNLTNVSLPDSVTTIGTQAFRECYNLKSVNIPDKVTLIDYGAFTHCQSLTTITIPKSVTTITEGAAFWGCNSLKEIIVDAENSQYKSIEGVLFNKNQTQLLQYPAKKANTTYAIPASVTTIGMGAFWPCENLKSISIPNGLIKIDSYAFFSNKSLENITIPASVKEIGSDAFANCTSLTKIVIPSSIKTINNRTFEQCENLKEIVIPKSITKIGIEAFSNCSSLTQITIPEGVQSIETNAFSECPKLRKIVIPKSVIDMAAFDDTFDPIFERSPNVTIYGYPGSTAEAYAKAYSIPFISLTAKKTQIITAKSYTKTYGNKAFSLNAKTNGGGKLSYQSSNTKVATVSSTGKITLKGPGKATITITAAATSNYNSATKRITITVKPKKVVLKKAKSTKKRTLKVMWKRDTKATGYQVVIAQNKKFKKGKKTALIKKNKTTAKTFKKLKSRKTYYYKVRAYKTVSGKKLYGDYSKTKRIRVR